MRSIFPGVLLLLLQLNGYSQARKQAVESKIERVTVYIRGAQVTRSALANLPAGKTELVFSGISPLIDKQSIQLKAEGKLTVLSVSHQLNFLKAQEARQEILDLEEKRTDWAEKVRQEKNLQQVFRQEEALLLKNQEIKGDQAVLKTADLREAADFQRQRLTEVYQKLSESEKTVKRYEAEIEKTAQQLQALNAKKDQSTSEIQITVSSKEPVTAKLQLSYLVKEAAWYPSYDVRVKDISTPLLLQYKANIRQSSGEDWKEVRLTLSTGDPKASGSRPQLSPWYLYYLANVPNSGLPGTSEINQVRGRLVDTKGNPIPAASVMIKGTMKGTVTDANGYYSITTSGGNETLVFSGVGFNSTEVKASAKELTTVLKEATMNLQEVVVVGYSSTGGSDYSYDRSPSYTRKKDETAVNTTTVFQPTTTSYEIEEPFTIMNDGKNRTADIDQYEIRASYEYYVAPKLELAAYLTAAITDWQDLNLLPGDANLFFEGNFLGTSQLDVQNAGDTLRLSLGKDRSVLVNRKMLKEYSQKKFLGSNRIDSREFEITVRNTKAQPVSITVEDQFPISNTKEIEVDNKKAPEARVEDNTEKISWTMQLEPGKENKYRFSYTVKYPKDRRLQLD